MLSFKTALIAAAAAITLVGCSVVTATINQYGDTAVVVTSEVK